MIRPFNKITYLSDFYHYFENWLSRSVICSFLPEDIKKATILVYHNITSEINKSKMQLDSVKIDEFERQMLFLRENDFNVITLKKLLKVLINGEKIKKKTIVITFDDGYKTHFLRAFPILQKYNIPATVFLAVNYIGKDVVLPWIDSFDDLDKVEDLRPLDWEEVRKLYHAGIEIGSHTFSHKFLPKMDKEAIQNELIISAATIREVLGKSPTSFALPFSFPIKHRSWPHFKSTLMSALHKAGYTSCCTSCRGYVDLKSNTYMLKRIFINKYDTLQSFYLKSIGAYMWTRFPQFIFQKYFKNYDNLYINLDNQIKTIKYNQYL